MANIVDYVRAIRVLALAGNTTLFDRLPRTKWYKSVLEPLNQVTAEKRKKAIDVYRPRVLVP